MKSIEMKVSGLMVDPLTSMPIVILKSVTGDRLLPIWIGPFEAQAIAMVQEHVPAPRPLTHDLLLSALRQLKSEVLKIVINDLRDSTFFALIHVRTAQGLVEIDSRPSDAIALALRAEVPILVEPEVFARSLAVDEERPEDTEQRLKQWFETVNPGDFSKYQM